MKINLNKPKTSIWKLPKRKNDYYQGILQNENVRWSTLKNALESADVFFIDENGYSVQTTSNYNIPHEASCMFCKFTIKGKSGFQVFYALKRKMSDGLWGDIKFASQLKIGTVEFEKIET